MPEEKVETVRYECARCNHKWFAKKKRKPIICPKCKSAYWDEERESTK